MKQDNRTARQAGVRHPARRRFIQTFLGAGATLAVPSLWASTKNAPERSLALRNLHTGETLKTTFWADGQYLQDELKAIDTVLRDHRSGDIYRMDPQLIDVLYLLQQSVGIAGPFHIISGYRSPASNKKLRNTSSGVAKRSLHMQGKAVDIRLPGCKLARLRNAALELKAGGVGYYAKSDFIHVDTGRVRRW
jgi:uncharacterized protein YcbK (DUF882 family)